MPRQTDIAEKVRKLRTFYGQHRRAPGYAEMLDLFGYKSKNAVHRLLARFDELGYIDKQGHKFALTDRVTGHVQLLGTVQAGFPSPAEEELLDTLSLDEFLIERPEATFMLKVTGTP